MINETIDSKPHHDEHDEMQRDLAYLAGKSELLLLGRGRRQRQCALCVNVRSRRTRRVKYGCFRCGRRVRRG